jgi:phosphopantothenoylcysteine decarboxylase/phosphopantothenate--cysteine ligase
LSPLVRASVEVVEVDSAAAMAAAVAVARPRADVCIMAAAVADFRPVLRADRKLTKDLGIPAIELEETEDILATTVANRRPGQTIVGFAAETHDVAARAAAKLARKGCDLLVVNDVAADAVGFDHETNAVMLLSADGRSIEVPLTSKATVALAVLDRVGELRTAASTERTPS